MLSGHFPGYFREQTHKGISLLCFKYCLLGYTKIVVGFYLTLREVGVKYWIVTGTKICRKWGVLLFGVLSRNLPFCSAGRIVNNVPSMAL